jgi:predicted ATPase
LLESLDLRNFKSWREAKIDFAPITGLFGTNSSGKSSLIQFLLMLKQTREERDRTTVLQLNGPFVELGQFSDVITGHKTDSHLLWTLNFQCDKEIKLNDPGDTNAVVASGQTVGVSSEVEGELSKGASVFSMRAVFLEYSLGGVTFRLSQKANDYDLISAGGSFSFVRNQGRVRLIPGPVRSYAFPDQARTYYKNAQFLADLETAYEAQLDKLFYLGPLRVKPARDYYWTGARPLDVGSSGERTIEALVAATAAGERVRRGPQKHSRPLQEVVAYWLRHLELIDSFRVEEVAKGSNRWVVKLRVSKGSPWVALTDVGTGVSQVLPVITLLQYVPEGATVLLEQPEIHLHPLAQAGLADVIISAALHRKVQVIVESHSEHLLLRLQRRIAEAEIAADRVGLYFASAANGFSRLSSLELDAYGNITNWPERFMGDAFGEVATAELKRIERRRESEAAR